MADPTQPLRVAIVGTGLQGHRRATAILQLPSLRLAAVASRCRDDATEFARQYHAAAARDWSEAVVAENVNAVLVCTPPDSHAEIALAAIAAGKHVLCEKPMARTSAEAADMVAAGERAGVVVSCGFNHRYHPAVAALAQLVRDGALGRPYQLRCAYGIAGRPGYEGEWRFDPQVVSGGHLMEQGIHAIDLAQWLLGEVSAITATCATQHWPSAGLEDNAVVLLRFSSGAVAEIHSSLTQWVNLFRVEIGGEHAFAVAEGLGGGYGDETLTVWRRTDGPFAAERTVFRGVDQSWRLELAEFVRQISAGELVRHAHPGVSSLRLVELAYQADRQQIWITP